MDSRLESGKTATASSTCLLRIATQPKIITGDTILRTLKYKTHHTTLVILMLGTLIFNPVHWFISQTLLFWVVFWMSLTLVRIILYFITLTLIVTSFGALKFTNILRILISSASSVMSIPFGVAICSLLDGNGYPWVWATFIHIILVEMLMVIYFDFRPVGPDVSHESSQIFPDISANIQLNGRSIALSDLISIKADDHFCQIVISGERLYERCRFGDLIKQIPNDAGLSLSRSAWISYSAIADIGIIDRRMYVLSASGEKLFVSRSRKLEVKTALGKLI